MDKSITELVRSIWRSALIRTDRELVIQEVYDDHNFLQTDPDLPSPTSGQLLTTILPELIGREELLEQILGGVQPGLELRWVHRIAASDTCYYHFYTRPYKDEDGQIQGLLQVVEDVTEIGQLQRQISQSRKALALAQGKLEVRNRRLAAANLELKQTSALKSQFVSVASHELRTPLASIVGYIDILLTQDFGDLTTDQEHFLKTMGQGAQRLLVIVNNLLDVTMLEAGQIELNMHLVDLASLASRVIVEQDPMLNSRQISVQLNVLPAARYVMADEVRSAQILGNLLANGCKYTEPGGRITLATQLADEEGFVRISVHDTGIGIAEPDQPRLFSRFFRAGSARRINTNGAGLGLYITRNLVELHGGRIWLDSQLGMGSVFHFTLPLHPRNHPQ